MIPAKIRRRFTSSIQQDSELLRQRIARAQRLELIRRGLFSPYPEIRR